MEDQLKIDLRSDLSFANLLCESYRRLTGKQLVPSGIPAGELASWLYSRAPFAVLAHNTESDPIFIYGNKAAQRLFEYAWTELVALPSRLSAEAPERGERQRFLEQVAQHGFIDGYSGVRITKSGKRFRIENATVWQLIDADGRCHGQAAMLP